MEMYWPQHRVFFVATLALFPENLKDVIVTLSFYRPYFADDSVAVIELTLQEYQKAGYIEYEKLSEGEFRVADIDILKAADDLIEYLKKWQSNSLALLAAKKPADSHRLRQLLLDALINAYRLNPQCQQRLTLEDIFGSPNNDVFGTPFWELVLSLHFSDNPQAKVTNIGYDRSQSGLYKDDAQPYIDFRITDHRLRRSLELAAKSSEPISDDDPAEGEPYQGLLARRDGLIYYNEQEVPFSPQQREVMRVFLKRPEELRVKEAFTDAEASVFSRENYRNIDVTLAKLIAATHATLKTAVGKECIFNTANQGWKLKL